MKKQETWDVIGLTVRKGDVYVQLGHRTNTITGPTIVVPLEESPMINDQVRVTYEWGHPLESKKGLHHVDEIGFSGAGGAGSWRDEYPHLRENGDIR